VWPGADDGHVVGEDVEQLRKFIEAIFPQEFAEPGYPFVVFGSRPELVRGDGLVFHAPELIDRKGGACNTHPMGFEENGSSAGEFDDESDQQAERHQQEDHGRREDDIEGSFQEPVGVGIERKGPHLQQGDIAEAADFEMYFVRARKVRDEMSSDAIPFRDGDQVFDCLHLAQGQDDKGVFEGAAVKNLLKIVYRADHIAIAQGGGLIREQADGSDTQVLIGDKIILKLGTQFIIADDDGRLEIEVGIKEIPEKEPGGNAELQEEEQGNRGQVLPFGAYATV